MPTRRPAITDQVTGWTRRSGPTTTWRACSARRTASSSTATSSARTAARPLPSSPRCAPGWATGWCSRSGTSRSPRSTPSPSRRRWRPRPPGCTGSSGRCTTGCSSGDEPHLRQADLRGYAAEIGVPPEKVVWPATQFVEDRVEADFNSGVRSGVRGTPTLFVDGVRYRGDVDGAGPARGAGGMTVRIATFNLLHGLDVRSNRVDLDAAAEAIEALDVDVVAVQEVDRGLSAVRRAGPGRRAGVPPRPHGDVRTRAARRPDAALDPRARRRPGPGWPGVRDRPDQQAAPDGRRDRGAARRRSRTGPSPAPGRPPSPDPLPRRGAAGRAAGDGGGAVGPGRRHDRAPVVRAVAGPAAARHGRRFARGGPDGRAPPCSSATSTCRRGWSSRPCAAGLADAAGGAHVPVVEPGRAARPRARPRRDRDGGAEGGPGGAQRPPAADGDPAPGRRARALATPRGSRAVPAVQLRTARRRPSPPDANGSAPRAAPSPTASARSAQPRRSPATAGSDPHHASARVQASCAHAARSRSRCPGRRSPRRAGVRRPGAITISAGRARRARARACAAPAAPARRRRARRPRRPAQAEIAAVVSRSSTVGPDGTGVATQTRPSSSSTLAIGMRPGSSSRRMRRTAAASASAGSRSSDPGPSTGRNQVPCAVSRTAGPGARALEGLVRHRPTLGGRRARHPGVAHVAVLPRGSRAGPFVGRLAVPARRYALRPSRDLLLTEPHRFSRRSCRPLRPRRRWRRPAAPAPRPPRPAARAAPPSPRPGASRGPAAG